MIDVEEIIKKDRLIERFKNAQSFKLGEELCDGDIYFLMIDDYVCYVGKSICPQNRVYNDNRSCHVDSNKKFNRVKVLSLKKGEFAYEVEPMYINLFSPYYNSAQNYDDYTHLIDDEYWDMAQGVVDELAKEKHAIAVELSKHPFFS